MWPDPKVRRLLHSCNSAADRWAQQALLRKVQEPRGAPSQQFQSLIDNVHRRNHNEKAILGYFFRTIYIDSQDPIGRHKRQTDFPGRLRREPCEEFSTAVYSCRLLVV